MGRYFFRFRSACLEPSLEVRLGFASKTLDWSLKGPVAPCVSCWLALGSAGGAPIRGLVLRLGFYESVVQVKGGPGGGFFVGVLDGVHSGTSLYPHSLGPPLDRCTLSCPSVAAASAPSGTRSLALQAVLGITAPAFSSSFPLLP